MRELKKRDDTVGKISYVYGISSSESLEEAYLANPWNSKETKKELNISKSEIRRKVVRLAKADQNMEGSPTNAETISFIKLNRKYMQGTKLKSYKENTTLIRERVIMAYKLV